MRARIVPLVEVCQVAQSITAQGAVYASTPPGKSVGSVGKEPIERESSSDSSRPHASCTVCSTRVAHGSPCASEPTTKVVSSIVCERRCDAATRV
eukprot:910649-Prymnesium_polylepis.2